MSYTPPGRTPMPGYDANSAGIIFVGASALSLGNVLTDTSLLPLTIDPAGGNVLPAGFWRVGRVVRRRMGGNYSTGPISLLGGAAITDKLGSTVLSSVNIGTIINGATMLPFDSQVDMVCTAVGTTGSLIVSGSLRFMTPAGGIAFVDLSNGGNPVTIDTTVPKALDTLFRWTNSNGAQALKVLSITAEVLN